MALKIFHPASQRQRVMFAKRLHITNLKTRRFGCAQCFSQRAELAVREHILVNERLLPPWRICGSDYPGVQEQTSGFKQIKCAMEIGGQIAHAHMFKHSYARQFVKFPGKILSVAVVAVFNEAAISHMRFRNPAGSDSRLVLAHRNPARLCPVVSCSVNHKASPATSEIHETIARLEFQFTADEIEFIGLCSIQPFSGTSKVSRRVHQCWAEPRLIELHWQIIVVRDRARISL